MKAVLEFRYPDDEDELRHALHGSVAVHALADVDSKIAGWVGSEPQELIDAIKGIVHDALLQCGEK